MDFIIELIGTIIIELLFEGTFSIITNKKISMWIRLPVLIVVILLFSLMIFGIIGLGVSLIKVNLLAALFMIILGIIILVLSIIQFRKQYLKMYTKDKKR